MYNYYNYNYNCQYDPVFNNLNISGCGYVRRNLTICNDTNIGGNLNVSKNINISGNLEVKENIEAKNIKLKENIEVEGVGLLKNLRIYETAEILNLNTDTLTNTSNVNILRNLNVYGDETLVGNLNANQNIYLGGEIIHNPSQLNLLNEIKKMNNKLNFLASKLSNEDKLLFSNL